MKKVTLELFEAGDHLMVTSGYNKGKVGVVTNHSNATSHVYYRLAGKDYDEDNDNDDWDDDEDYYGEDDHSDSKYLKFITKKEYEDTLIKLKILHVPGLPVAILYRNNSFIIGDNVVTPANAEKIAEFITANKPKAKKK